MRLLKPFRSNLQTAIFWLQLMKKYTVYALSDPRTGNIRYIGKSSSGLKRGRSHSYPSALKKNRTRCGNWVKSLVSLGLLPVVEEVEVHDNHDAVVQAEIFYIAYFRSLGFDLTNHTTGGEGAPGMVLSKEHKEKLRCANLGNKHCLGKKMNFSDETRAALSKRAKARSADPAIRSKIATTLSGRKQDKAVVEKRAAKLRGKKGLPPSQETRERMSRSALRRTDNLRPIQDNNGTHYSSIAEAAAVLKLSAALINRVLKGTRNHTGGFTFRYTKCQ